MRGNLLFRAVLGALPLLGGCATSGSLAGKDGCKVYGGTRLDAALITENLAPDSEAAKSEGLERPILVWAACCGLVDMPLSFLADTALLPLTVPIAIGRLGSEPQSVGQGSNKDKAVAAAGSPE
jgi:uncharacterized protein YceK